ncbi:hypothetical protein V8F33_013236 [Rhypophila sp. PSN 637]
MARLLGLDLYIWHAHAVLLSRENLCGAFVVLYLGHSFRLVQSLSHTRYSYPVFWVSPPSERQKSIQNQGIKKS